MTGNGIKEFCRFIPFPQNRPTKRAPDAGDSAHTSSSFLRLSIFLAGRLRRPRPSAGNANRWATQRKRFIMLYIKIGLTTLLLIGTFSSFVYSFNLFLKFLGKRLSKRDVIKKTFLTTFFGFMFLFLGYFIWQADWHIMNWIFFLGVFATISIIFATASIAPYWEWKE